ncbi:MAG TPA: RluA family pseudouridine synthase [Vicinamibacterales bacterium]|nr:RluA family pseudouridine synthase [Vicinamibacterales bacterium]
MPLPPRTIVADRGDAGRRIDLVLRRHLTDLASATRSRVQAWIESGRVSINGQVVHRVSTRAALGDEVIVSLPDEDPRAPVIAQAGQLDRLFEDSHLLVVNKPAGVVSHPTFRHPSGSLLNTVLHHALSWPAGQRPSLVGRLDKLTSGALIVAKSGDAHARLQRVLASALSEKSYLAVVYGPVDPDRGTIELRLRRHPDDRRRVIATPRDGAVSVTRFERLAEIDCAGCTVTLVRCQLLTGRMHQVRVHMAARGWPLVGDAKYGEPRWERCRDAELRSRLETFPRQALHAWRLSFVHPFTMERIAVVAPVPQDVRELMAACGLSVSSLG